MRASGCSHAAFKILQEVVRGYYCPFDQQNLQVRRRSTSWNSYLQPETGENRTLVTKSRSELATYANSVIGALLLVRAALHNYSDMNFTFRNCLLSGGLS